MHEWRSHTAEIELVIETASEEEVFVEAAAAFGELVGRDGGGAPTRREVKVEAPDRETLLVQWLEELVFLADTESFVPEGAQELRLDETTVQATLVGRHAAVEPLVKAATYHRLRFAHEDGTWCARVVLDV